jgi:hypothetical protein
VPDGEDTAVHAVQPARAEAMVDGAHAESGGPQLSEAHYAVLGRGQARDPRVGADVDE